MRADIKEWDPEDSKKWDKRLAWTTVWISTFSLTFGFCAWYLCRHWRHISTPSDSTSTRNSFTGLVAMVGLSAGTLRIVWTFLPPIMGTRKLVFMSTALLLIPLACWIYAVTNPGLPFEVLMLFAFLAGIGGGTFSGLMASTNYYFPKSKRGFALGVQGGLSDFGTSLVQFVTPIVITFSVFGILGSPQHEVVDGHVRDVWLQNAGWVWVPLVIILAILAIVLLRSVPVTSNFKTQLSIFKSKHTWFMTLFYYGTFATFAGLGAHFALMGR